jgi:hypothetical protein
MKPLWVSIPDAWWFHRPDIDECMAQGLSPPRALYFSPHISLSRPQLHVSEDVLRKWVETAMENNGK